MRAAPRYGREEAEFDRAIGFVDATFALALTLLVTTLEVGEDPVVWTSPSALGDAVGVQFLAFLISFVVIANYWLAHHQLVASFAAIDVPVIVANLGLIGAIVLLPFSTEAVGDPGVDDLPLPTALLAVNVAAASLLHSLVFAMAVRRDLLATRPSRDEYLAALLPGLVPAAVFLLSVPIAYLVDPVAAQLLWLTLLVLPVLSRRALKRAGRDPVAADRPRDEA
jgi:uncharacterized membrane protein